MKNFSSNFDRLVVFLIYEKGLYANAEQFKSSVIAAVKSFCKMPFEKKKTSVTVKLIYHKDNNLATVMREYRGLKDYERTDFEAGFGK